MSDRSSPQRSRKRVAGQQITDANYENEVDDSNVPAFDGSYEVAAPEVLAKRKIVTLKRSASRTSVPVLTSNLSWDFKLPAEAEPADNSKTVAPADQPKETPETQTEEKKVDEPKSDDKKTTPVFGSAFPAASSTFSFTGTSTFGSGSNMFSFSPAATPEGSNSADFSSIFKTGSAFSFGSTPAAGSEANLTTPSQSFTPGFTFAPFNWASKTAEEDSGGEQEEKEEEIKVNLDNVKTGEEDEEKEYSVKAKLFAWDSAARKWAEKGYGLLKVLVRKDDSTKTRLVMRIDGAQRLILNSPIFASMKINSFSEKAVQFTGIEESKPVTYVLKFASAIEKTDTLTLLEAKHKLVSSATTETAPEKKNEAVAETPAEKKAEAESTEKKE